MVFEQVRFGQKISPMKKLNSNKLDSDKKTADRQVNLGQKVTFEQVKFGQKISQMDKLNSDKICCTVASF